MEKIKIITDTACDIDYQKALELDVDMLPIIVNIDGEDKREQFDIKKQDFLKYLQNLSSSMPTTTQITHIRWLEAFEKAFENGYNKIICIPICSSGSGTYQSAFIAKEMFDKKHNNQCEIVLIDAKTYSIGYGRLVMDCVKMRDEKVAFSEICRIISERAKQVEILFIPYTLDFARKSGRISCAAALLGGVLGLKPIIYMVDGVSTIISKFRGQNQIVPKLVELVKENAVNIESQVIDIAYGDIGDDHKILEKALKEEFGGNLEIRFSMFGSSISLNAGPVTIGISYYGKQR